MSQETKACDFWKNEVKGLRRRWQSNAPRKIARENSMHHPSVPTPTERVDSPLQTSRPAEGNPWRSVTDESISNRNVAVKFEFEPWPQASKFNSWKVSFRREEISGSTHPRLISEWLAEIDVAASMGDLDHSSRVRQAPSGV